MIAQVFASVLSTFMLIDAAGSPGAAQALLDTQNQLVTSSNSVAIGFCAVLPVTISKVVIIGNFVTVPADAPPGYVNIGNKFCGVPGQDKDMPCPLPVNSKDCR